MNSNPKVFVTTIDTKLGDKIINDLCAQGFDITTPQYTIFSAKRPGISCTLYQSGKLTVQGKETAAFVEFYLEPHILKNFAHTHIAEHLNMHARIGIDESGKGDFFGPLCIAGVYAKDEQIAKLKAIGVQDSKNLSDSAVIKIANAIKYEVKHHIVRINPLKYNELQKQFGNLNHLLAWGHATTIEQLVIETACRDIIIDQFADERVVIRALKRKKLEVNLTQRHRAEEDLVVAAASILARQAFLEGLRRLGEEVGINLPKGASKQVIEAGKKIYERHGIEGLQRTAKLHFKTIHEILK